MNAAIVELDKIELQGDRDGFVFRDLSLKIAVGRSAVIVGRAGSGKSSLAELVVGLRKADSGTIRLFDQELKRRNRSQVKRLRRKIGGVGGLFGLMSFLSVADNILLPLILNGDGKIIQRERLRTMLTEFSLLQIAGKYPSQLTRVEHSLVQFARASIADQPLLIVDEPLAGLDSTTYERIHEYLFRAAISGRSMILLVSDPPAKEIPNADVYHLDGGMLS